MTAAAKPAFNKVKLAFLKEIAKLCNGSRPSVKNTRETMTSMSYKVKVTDTKDYGAERYLQSLGFVSANIKPTGGSTHGDFSSDAYGINLTHPNGVKVTCGSWFGGEKPTFSITITGTAEQIAQLTEVK
jgi:hypothetical protein